jgi:5-oxoprolinase (ATP-hydrolysing)
VAGKDVQRRGGAEAESGAPRWRVWVDTGGTFTDCVAVAPGERTVRVKVLSSSALRGRVAAPLGGRRLRLEPAWALPRGFFSGFTFRLLGRAAPPTPVVDWEPEGALLELEREPQGAEAGLACELLSPEEAPVLAVRLATATPPGSPLPPLAVRLATTRGTNALLERKGAPTALFITRGFGDLLEIGTQQRADLFALRVEKPPPLYAAVVEVEERLAADGSVLRAVDARAVATEARALLARGITVAAVALMHAYRNPAHEEEVAAELRRAGFAHVSCSAALAPLIKLLPRAETAVVDATLSPVIGEYLARVEGGVGAVQVMTSAGGLVSAAAFHPKDSLLSGPAGGVVGATRAGRRSGLRRLISFDMGGTSTDVARVDGDYEYVFEHTVGDAHLVAPALAVETVAAGGGSVCAFDGRRLRVGPDSAGAQPGPACYGAGGPLTVTDVNLLLGRLEPDGFEIPLTVEAAEEALQVVLDGLAAAGAPAAPEAVLSGFLQIANERMADAIRRISLRRGYDPAEHALVAFGGAGAQHACAVAELLGMSTVVVPPDASLLSALGLGHAVVERFAQRQVLLPLEEATPRLGGWLAELAAGALAAVVAEGVPEEAARVRRRIAHLRFVGQDATVGVEVEEGVSLAAGFAEAYRALYGYRPEERPVEVESLRVVASAAPEGVPPVPAPAARCEAAAEGMGQAFFAGSWADVPRYLRDKLPPGATLAGPALVAERHSLTVLEPRWGLEVDGAGALLLRRRGD